MSLRTRRARALALALMLGSSSCQLIAGIDDKHASPALPLDGGVGTGGSTGSGGSTAAGGRGGNDGGGIGGSSFVADAAGTGGWVGRGGNTGNGGQTTTSDAGLGGTRTGGVSVTGGAATGGVATGGIVATGGARTGGASGTGGAPGSGGMGTGGASGTGGAVGTGGRGTGGSATGGNGGGTGGNTTPDAAPDGPSDAPTCPAVGVVGDGTGLLGEYFMATDLTGLVVSRIDPSISFHWYYGSPDVSVPVDNFSVRWTGQVQPRFSGRTTFITYSDDGIRVWINGTLVIDDWTPAHAGKEASGSYDVVAGQKYDIKVEHYELDGWAIAQLSWQSDCQVREMIPSTQLYPPTPTCATPVAGSGTGVQGEYFDNPDFTARKLTRSDATIAFTWPTGTAPASSLAPDTYAIRFTGQVQPRYSGFTTFYLVSDDGARLFVDDRMLIDDWGPHGRTEDLATLSLVAGQKYNLRVDYWDGVGGGQVQLLWGSPCQTKEIIPQPQLYPSYTGLVCPEGQIGTGTGLRGEYYDNVDFTNLVVVHPAEAVNFDWGTGTPDPAMDGETFSVRWSGQIEPRYTGPTTFWTTSDDDVRLWVAGQLVIDHASGDASGTLDLTAGQKVDVRIDFQEDTGAAAMKLFWSGACQPKDIVPATQLYPAAGPVDAGLDANPDGL